MRNFKLYLLIAVFGILNLLFAGVLTSPGDKHLLLGFGIFFIAGSLIGLLVSFWETQDDQQDLTDEAIREKWGK